VGQSVSTEFPQVVSQDAAATELVFTIDGSIAAPDGEIIRYGTPVPACTQLPGAAPDPATCVSATGTSGDDTTITVLTRESGGFWGYRLPKAGRVFVDQSTGAITYTAHGGESNDVALLLESEHATLTDVPAGTITPGTGCEALSASQVRCARDDSGFSGSYVVSTGDLADTIKVSVDVANSSNIISSSSNGGVLFGGDGADELRGGSKSDALVGGAGADVLDGGEGDDVAWYGDRTEGVTVTTADGVANDGNADDGPAGARDLVQSSVEGVVGGDAADTLTGGNGPDHLAGAGGSDVLTGGGGSDDLNGGATWSYVSNYLYTPPVADGDDTLHGDDGADRMDGDMGADTFDGGAGSDVVSYSDHAQAVTVTIGAGVRNDGSAEDGASVRDDVEADVEAVTGGTAGDTLTGNDGANHLDGGGGSDTIAGGGGSDLLLAGSDTVIDTLNGGDGNDTFSATSTYDGTHDGGDVFAGGGGTDLVDYSGREQPVTVTLADNAANDGQPGEGDTIRDDVEDVSGGQGDDVLTGDDDANRLNGGSGGNDRLVGLGGADRLRGGYGYGYGMDGGDGADTFDAGPGQDIIRARDGAVDTVGCGSELDVAYIDAASTYGGQVDDATDADCENRNPETVSQSVEPGETAGSAEEATDEDPIDVAITSPNGGRVDIQESTVTQTPNVPADQNLLALELDITAPDATVANPLVVKFIIDGSLIPAGGAQSIRVYRDGVALDATCPGGGQATDLGCISQRETLDGGDVRLTVLTAHASAWNFSVPKPTTTTTTPPDDKTSTGPGATTTTRPADATTATPKTTATPGPAPDRTAPLLTLKLKKLKLTALLKSGLLVPIRCDELCTAAGQLRLDTKTAENLKLPAIIGKASARRGTTMKLKVTTKARRKLAKLRSLKLTLRITVKDAAGNAKTTTRKLSVKR
jgi:Ca2+-binding RTX toxin-like protein